MVVAPPIADARVAVVACYVFHSFTCGGIDTVATECEVMHDGSCSVGAQIPCFFDFVACEVQHHHSETCGQVGFPIIEADMRDAFVACYFATFDVGDVIDMVAIEDVDVGVGVGYHKVLRGVVICHGGHSHVAETCTFAEGG